MYFRAQEMQFFLEFLSHSFSKRIPREFCNDAREWNTILRCVNPQILIYDLKTQSRLKYKKLEKILRKLFPIFICYFEAIKWRNPRVVIAVDTNNNSGWCARIDNEKSFWISIFELFWWWKGFNALRGGENSSIFFWYIFTKLYLGYCFFAGWNF